MIQFISFMYLRGNSWLRGLHLFKFVLETLIASLIFRHFTILGLNFITRVNCAARWKYSFGHSNVCLNTLMISMLNRKVFQVKRTMNVHMEVYTITTDRPCTCVQIPLRNICDFSVISKVWNSTKTAIQTPLFISVPQKTAKNHVLVIKTQNNSRFSNFIAHTYIRKHSWLSLLYRNAL